MHSPSPPPVDWARLLDILDQDRAAACELAQVFIEMGVQAVQEMMAAAEQQDCETAAKRAHKLKGASASIQAPAMAAASSRLELAARDGQTELLAGLAQDVKLEFERAAECLRAFAA